MSSARPQQQHQQLQRQVSTFNDDTPRQQVVYRWPRHRIVLYDSYCCRQSMCAGTTLLITGLLSVVLQSVSIAAGLLLSSISHGIWCGVMVSHVTRSTHLMAVLWSLEWVPGYLFRIGGYPDISMVRRVLTMDISKYQAGLSANTRNQFFSVQRNYFPWHDGTAECRRHSVRFVICNFLLLLTTHAFSA